MSLLTSPVVGRYLLCPGHLSVPATGRRLTQCIPDGASHENTESLQHPNPGPVLLLLQCHFGARPKAGSAPSQSVSFSPDFPNQSMSPEISAVDLLTPSRVVWPISEPRKINFLKEAVLWNEAILLLQARPRRDSDKKRSVDIMMSQCDNSLASNNVTFCFCWTYLR